MKRSLIFVGLVLVFAAGLILFHTSPTSKPTPIIPSEQKASSYSLYYVLIEDNGQKGDKIGCGDSVVGVKKDTTDTPSLESALTELLANKTQQDLTTGYYNALYQSDLSIDHVTENNEGTNVYLKGTLMLGGVCDNPRVKAQLEKTVGQFVNGHPYTIYIHDQKIDDALSEK